MPTRIEDLLDLDSLLTPEDIELRQTVRRFGDQRLRPHVADWFDSGLRSLVSVQGSLAMFAIYRWGSEEQRNQWLPAMATGDVIGCFGLTEPDFGSNPAGMRTTARRDGSDWIL